MPRLDTGNGRITSAAAMIAALGSIMTPQPIHPDEGIQYHDEPQIFVPNGWSYQQIRDAVNRAEKEAETTTRWMENFLYRPDDGAYALMEVLKARYGGAVGEATMGFFGPEPPELDTIDIAYGVTAQVPRGKLSLPAMPGLEITSTGTHKREYGVVFAVVAEGPRKYKNEVAELFADVHERLKAKSIYRGQQVAGSDELKFIDLSGFKSSQIVFSERAMSLLDATLWGPLKHWRLLEAEGVPLKRAVILHGPYGTGKTSAGMITAQIAKEAGWTYIAAKAGKDAIADALRTARLYQPAVVFVEDFDNEGPDETDGTAMSKLLEAFDGAASKDNKVMVVVTTNHIDRIPRGMLRPGRFDAMVEISYLDRISIEKLIKAVVSADKRLADIDYDAVAAEMPNFLPAFVREAVNRAQIIALQNHGRDYVLDTESLVTAAQSLQEQLRYMEEAGEGTKRPGLEANLLDLVREGITGGRSALPLKVQGHQDFYIVEQGSHRDDNSPDFTSVNA